MENQYILKAENISKTFAMEAGFFSKNRKNVYALNDVSFSLPFGKTYGILGESGCGKTTCARVLLQLYKHTSGKIFVNKKIFDDSDFNDNQNDKDKETFLEISSFSRKEVKKYRQKVKYIFQDPAKSLNPKMTVLQILTEPLKYSGEKTSKKERFEKAAKIIEEVGLSKEDLSRRPQEFSGGQRQRISIARALIMNPKLLICDEVVSALDVSIQGQIINMLSDLQEKRNLSYVFITHDLRVACFFCDTIAVMYRGVLVEQGEAKDFYRNALHPYTKLLFEGASVNLNNSSLEIKSVLQSETSCPFSHRCPKATEKCRTEKPELKSVSQNQKVRCFYI